MIGHNIEQKRAGRGFLIPLRSVLLTLLAVSTAESDEQQPVLAGTVSRVIDGDTIYVEADSGPMRVRLHGVDAPESGQPHGKAAKDELSKRVLNAQVELELVEQDRYERLVAIVYTDGTNVNAKLVDSGAAWAYRRYMRKVDAALCRAEAEARRARRGLWSLPAAKQVAPWEYRRRKTVEQFTDYRAETFNRCVSAIGKR